MPLRVMRVSSLVFICVVPLMAGCGSLTRGTSLSSAVGPRIGGHVHGGQQPIAGAAVQMYAASTAGDGAPGIPLLSSPAVTNANGEFTLGGYTCPSGSSQVIIVATGGNPGLNSGATNSAIALEAALGRCDGLTSSTIVQINELTTVVSVSSLLPFMSSPSGLGSSTSDQSALVGGFALANEMVNTQTGQLGGPLLPAGALVPVNEINTLADVIASCVNSAGPAAGTQTPCGTLFSLATPAGGATPADTITALLDLFANPENDVAQLISLAGAQALYQPTLGGTIPADLSVSLQSPDSIAFTPHYLSFPLTTVGLLSAAQEVKVINNGGTTVSVAASVLAGAATADFTSQSNCGQGSVSPGGTCSFLIWFQPQSAGSRTSTLILNVSGITTNIALSGTAQPATALISVPQPLADYSFLDGSGTTVSDSVGGYSGTFSAGSAAPTWTSTGLAFGIGQSVALPAALNPSQTVVAALYLTPLSNYSVSGQTQPQNATVITSSAGDSGLNFTAQYGDMNGASVASAYSPSLYTGNYVGFGTRSSVTLAGFHVFTWLLGTSGSSVDRLFVDGQEVSTYFQQVASGSTQSSGQYYFGAANVYPWQQSGLPGTMYRAQFYTQALTPAQIAATSASILTEVASRGVVTSPAPIAQSAPQLHCIGDSATYGADADFAFCSKLELSNKPQYTITNWGLPGFGITQIAGSEANRVAPLCQSIGGHSVALVWAGSNDFSYFRNPVAVVGSYMAQEIAALKASGCTVLIGTMLSRGGTGARAGESLDSDKDSWNDLLRAQWAVWGADGMTDYGAFPGMGADGAYANTTYFSADQTHPTDTGQLALAQIASNSLNYIFGTTPTQPTMPASASYSMQSGDRYLLLQNLSSGGTLTLPDCTGPTGGVYTIKNNQDGVAVMLQGMLNQPINSSSAPISLPGNTFTSLTVATNPSAQSGCYWKM